jgi:hypothetical protein
VSAGCGFAHGWGRRSTGALCIRGAPVWRFAHPRQAGRREPARMRGSDPVWPRTSEEIEDLAAASRATGSSRLRPRVGLGNLT